MARKETRVALALYSLLDPSAKMKSEVPGPEVQVLQSIPGEQQ